MCNNCLAEVLSIVSMPVTGDIFVRQTKEEEEDV